MVRFLLLVVLASAYFNCVAYESTSAQSWSQRLVDAAHKRLQSNVTYSGAFYAIEYPNGDVPANIGVCTDVVIRSFRELGVDLQQLVHEDMSAHFSKYPNLWGLKRPDPNIDHRRVPNLQVFFERNGTVRNISNDPRDYQPGDIVTWMLAGNLPHIGIVSNKKSPDGVRYLIVHNIGAGPKLEDFLFDARITGHYQFKNN